jgi:uncharacterized protein YifE (UPF0438 family)
MWEAAVTNLTPKEAALIKPYLKRFLDLVEGRRELETEAQRYFLECAHGRREPVTRYEIAFSMWQEGRPVPSAHLANASH